MKLWKILTLAGVCLASTFSAQEKDKKKWEVNEKRGPGREVSFTVNEGTWMNLDVSPDGKQIVFDLLGDIYIMPSSGGKATLLRGGLAYEVQPRFSPDGKRISFTSDAGGADNIWTMKTDGSDAKQITTEDFRLLNNAVWMPDGNYFIARKHFTSTRSAGAGEMWIYHSSGGAGIGLTKRKNDQQDCGEPWVSPDGKYLYYAEDMYPGGYFQYNKDPNSQIYVIKRYEFETGETETVVQGPGGAVRPVTSRDGKQLAFVRRVREQSVLFVKDLESGEEKPVFDQLSKDQQEAWAIFGVYSNFNFTPDNKAIIIWAGGKIRRIDLATLAVSDIPFEAEAKHYITDALHFAQQAYTDSFDVKVLRHATTSPDGKMLVFNALGYLWKASLPNGKPQRLTNATDFEFEPAFSPDGKKLVYVTWNDTTLGELRMMDWPSGKNSRKLMNDKGIFRTPKFDPSGQFIVYQKEEGNDQQGFTHCENPGIYLLKIGENKARRVSKTGDYPEFSADGKRIYYQTGGYLFGALDKGYRSVDLNGKDPKTHFTSKYANRYAISPDGQWIAFNELHNVYVAPFPNTGKPIEISQESKAYPVARLTRDAGINLHWSSDSKTLHYTLGNEYFSIPLKNRFKFIEGAPDSLPALDTTGIKINLKAASDKPKGKIWLKNARIITMNGDEVLENTDLLIIDNKIAAIGKNIDANQTKGAFELDCTGKTIMPGMIDVHAHVGNFRYGLSPQKQWHYYANLAYGVTTSHDPSSNSEMVFAQSELIKSGQTLGPRLFSTGTILYGADGDFKAVINSLDDARSSLRRTKAFGAFSVKSYNQPRRNQRQQVIQGSRELGIMVVPEGGSHFFHNMSMILDGHTGIEHNIPVAPVYDDVAKLWSNSKTGYTPTLIVNYGGLNGEYYWYEKTKVWEKQRLLNFTPRAIVDARARHRTAIPDEEYENGHILVAKSCKKLADAGVKVNLGAHGQLQGLGAHWELWMLAQGGFSPLEAIRCATVNGAYYIGMEDQLGQIKNGYLADLLIMDKNPLDNIQNTESLRYTIANGRLFDAESMNELGNQARKRGKFYWENKSYSQQFKFHEETHGFHDHSCGCRKAH